MADKQPNEKKTTKRYSILKRIDNANAPSSPTFTRRISFHGKNMVKEFTEGTDKATIWQDSYEEEAAQFSNEALTGASSAFLKSGMQHTNYDMSTCPISPNSKHSADSKNVGVDETLARSHRMSLTFCAAATTSANDEDDDNDVENDMDIETLPSVRVAAEHNDLEIDDDVYDDVASFNRSLDQLSFDNDCLMSDDDNNDDAAPAANVVQSRQPKGTPIIVRFPTKSPTNQTQFLGDTMNLTSAAPMRRSQRIQQNQTLKSPTQPHHQHSQHELTAAMDITSGHHNVPTIENPTTTSTRKSLHNLTSGMDFTRIPIPTTATATPTATSAISIDNNQSVDMDCSRDSSANRHRPHDSTATTQRTKPPVSVLRQLFSRRMSQTLIAPDSDSDMIISDPSVAPSENQFEDNTDQLILRTSLMEMTVGTPAANFSVFVDDESLPRDLFSSTRIGTQDQTFHALQQQRRSVIQRHNRTNAPADRATMAMAANAPPTTEEQQRNVDRERFDRTMQHAALHDADGLLADISGVLVLMTASGDESPATATATSTTTSTKTNDIRTSMPPQCDASSSMGLFRCTDDDNDNDNDSVTSSAVAGDNTSDLCRLDAEQICNVATASKNGRPTRKSDPKRRLSTLAAANLHFSRLNNHADLTLFDRTMTDDDGVTEEEEDESNGQQPVRATPSPDVVRVSSGGLVAAAEAAAEATRSARRCSIGTPVETEESLCRRCVDCHKRSVEQQTRAQRQRTTAVQLSPLGSMSSLLEAAGGAADEADDESLHIDYGGYDELSRYASAEEVFEVFRQRTERLAREREQQRMQISLNVPSPGYIRLLDNMLDVEFEALEPLCQSSDGSDAWAPFPIRRTVEFLLRNLFEDDSNLPWHYDPFWFQCGRIGLWNDRIPSVLLRLDFDVPDDTDDDLQFKRISFDACPKSVLYMNPAMWTKHNELLASLPFEMTGQCATSVHLRAFLDRLDAEHYQPAEQLARQIGRLAGENGAVLSRDPDGPCFIQRQIFNRRTDGGLQLYTSMTIKLTVVAQTTLQHVYLRPSRTLCDDASLALFGTGVSCIERLLTNPWSYLRMEMAATDSFAGETVGS